MSLSKTCSCFRFTKIYAINSTRVFQRSSEIRKKLVMLMHVWLTKSMLQALKIIRLIQIFQGNNFKKKKPSIEAIVLYLSFLKKIL